MVGGDVAAVQQSVTNGEQQAGHMKVDSMVLPNIHASVLPAISGVTPVEKRQALGVVETFSVAAADAAVKAANITLIRIHMAFGIGGKCYMVMGGEISDVTSAVQTASRSAGEKGLLVHGSIIPRPHAGLWQQLL